MQPARPCTGKCTSSVLYIIIISIAFCPLKFYAAAVSVPNCIPRPIGTRDTSTGLTLYYSHKYRVRESGIHGRAQCAAEIGRYNNYISPKPSPAHSSELDQGVYIVIINLGLFFSFDDDVLYQYIIIYCSW